MSSDVAAPKPAPALEYLMRHGVTAAVVCQAVLLVIAGWRNHELLNTDGIAYLRIASYYANGQTSLMISGYWGPLLSWLMVPWLKLGLDPLIAARVAMGLTALVFTTGCAALFQALELSAPRRLVGVWLVAMASIFWSVRYITPDLLLGGLMALGIAGVVRRNWLEDYEAAMQTGLFWGLAYLAKAVAFPLAFLIIGGLAETWRLSGASKRRILKSLGWTLVPFLVVTLPWIGVLSAKYEKFTFSTSGKINHAIAGPPDVERYHPFARVIRAPEAGRVTAWEDPSPLAYRYWSPFANVHYALHQLRLIAGNAPAVARLLGGANPKYLLEMKDGVNPQDVFRLLPGFDLFYLGLIGLVGCLVGWHAHLAQERWRWVIVPAIFTAGIYLPVYLLPDDQRYFYPMFPLLWVAATGWFGRLVKVCEMEETAFERTGWRIVTASFALPVLFWMLVALVGIPNPAATSARDLAYRMQHAKLSGPVVGNGQLPGGRSGLFLAYFLNQPWHGDSLTPSAAAYRAARVRFVVVRRGTQTAYELEADRSFQNLDPILFTLPKEAEESPLMVYELKALSQ